VLSRQKTIRELDAKSLWEELNLMWDIDMLQCNAEGVRKVWISEPGGASGGKDQGATQNTNQKTGVGWPKGTFRISKTWKKGGSKNNAKKQFKTEESNRSSEKKHQKNSGTGERALRIWKDQMAPLGNLNAASETQLKTEQKRVESNGRKKNTEFRLGKTTRPPAQLKRGECFQIGRFTELEGTKKAPASLHRGNHHRTIRSGARIALRGLEKAPESRKKVML